MHNIHLVMNNSPWYCSAAAVHLLVNISISVALWPDSVTPRHHRDKTKDDAHKGRGVELSGPLYKDHNKEQGATGAASSRGATNEAITFAGLSYPCAGTPLLRATIVCIKLQFTIMRKRSTNWQRNDDRVEWAYRWEFPIDKRQMA